MSMVIGGLTLRQWYAGQALNGFLSSHKGIVLDEDVGPLAQASFDIADAMVEVDVTVRPKWAASTLSKRSPV